MERNERLQHLASEAPGESVTVETLSETVGTGPLYRLLRADERPQYLRRGHHLDVVDRNAPESAAGRRTRKVASQGFDLITLVTDERVLVIVPRSEEAEQITVSLSEISHVDTESAPGVSRRLRVQTDDTTYYIDTSQSSSDDSEAVRKHLTDVMSRDSGVGDTDEILDTLERLADLRDRGTLTEGEFARKKTELLDRL